MNQKSKAFAQLQIQIAKHVNKRGIKMLNWDDPLNSVQAKNNTSYNSRNEANLKATAIKSNKNQTPPD